MCAERTKLGTAHAMVVNLAYIFNQMAVQTIANLCFLQQTERTEERLKKILDALQRGWVVLRT